MPRIVHLGLGAFHRAHQAVYLQRLHALGDTSWSLASGNIRPHDPGTIRPTRLEDWADSRLMRISFRHRP